MIGNSWDKELEVIWNSKGFNIFYNQIMELYKNKTIFPEKDNIFNIMLTNYDGYLFNTDIDEKVFNATLVMYFLKYYYIHFTCWVVISISI